MNNFVEFSGRFSILTQEIAERGGIFLNERVFVEIDMIDPLKSKDIVMSVQTCYATDSPQFSKMELYHYLIFRVRTLGKLWHNQDQYGPVSTNRLKRSESL